MEENQLVAEAKERAIEALRKKKKEIGKGVEYAALVDYPNVAYDVELQKKWDSEIDEMIANLQKPQEERTMKTRLIEIMTRAILALPQEEFS